MNTLQKEFLNGMLLLILGVWIWWYAGEFPSLPEGYPGPALFPQIIGVGLFLSGLLMVGVNLQNRKERTDKGGATSVDRRGLLRLVAGVTLIALYPFIRPWTGFVPALALICFVIAILLQARIWVAALTATGTVLFIYLIFSSLLGLAL